MKANIINKAVRLVTMTISSICIFFLLAYLSASATIFSQATMVSALNSSGYYYVLKDKLIETMSIACAQYDISPAVLDNYITEAIVKEEMESRINAFYKQYSLTIHSRFYNFENDVAEILLEQGSDKSKAELQSELLSLSVPLESVWVSAVTIPVQNLMQFLLFNAKPQLQQFALGAVLLLILSINICLRTVKNLSDMAKLSGDMVYGAGIASALSGILLIVFGISRLMPKSNLLYAAYSQWATSFSLALIIAGVIAVALMLVATIMLKKNIAAKKAAPNAAQAAVQQPSQESAAIAEPTKPEPTPEPEPEPVPELKQTPLTDKQKDKQINDILNEALKK